MSDAVAVARAVDELRRGRPVVVTMGDQALAVLAVELTDDESLATLEGGGRADLLVTHERAAVLKLTNQLPAAAESQPVRIRRAPWMDIGQSLAAADPVRDLATPLKGPYATAAPAPLPPAALAPPWHRGP